MFSRAPCAMYWHVLLLYKFNTYANTHWLYTEHIKICCYISIITREHDTNTYMRCYCSIEQLYFDTAQYSTHRIISHIQALVHPLKLRVSQCNINPICSPLLTTAHVLAYPRQPQSNHKSTIGAHRVLVAYCGLYLGLFRVTHAQYP